MKTNCLIFNMKIDGSDEKPDKPEERSQRRRAVSCVESQVRSSAERNRESLSVPSRASGFHFPQNRSPTKQ